MALDSGAYSVSTGQASIEIQDYIECIHEHQHLVEVYFNLDVLGDGEASYQNWLYMRRKGLNPVPVWHAGTPVKYLHRYLDETDGGLIAIGAIADLDTDECLLAIDRLWNCHLVDSFGRPKARFHCFGRTSPRIVTSFPWHSCDGKTWAMVGAYHAIRVPGMPEVSVTPETSRRENHINNLPPFLRKKALRYMEEKGFVLGRGKEDDTDFERGLCNDPIVRHQLNLLFYAEMGLEAGTKVYAAGCWETFGKIEVERRIQQAVYGAGLDYYRMISFAYYPEMKGVLDLKREELKMDDLQTEVETDSEKATPSIQPKTEDQEPKKREPISKPLHRYTDTDLDKEIDKRITGDNKVQFWEAGMFIVEKKRRLAHGQFMKWGKERYGKEFGSEKKCHQTLTNYMDLYLLCPDKEIINLIPLRLLYRITKESFPPELRQWLYDNVESLKPGIEIKELMEAANTVRKHGFNTDDPKVERLIDERQAKDADGEYKWALDKTLKAWKKVWEPFRDAILEEGLEPYGDNGLPKLTREQKNYQHVKELEQHGLMPEYRVFDEE